MLSKLRLFIYSELPFDALDDAQGVLYGKGLFLVSQQISSAEDANEVIFHEMVGHFGLRGFFGSALDFALDDIHLHNPIIRQYATEWRKSNKRSSRAKKEKARIIQSGGATVPIPHVPHNIPEDKVGKPEGLSGSQTEKSSLKSHGKATSGGRAYH